LDTRDEKVRDVDVIAHRAVLIASGIDREGQRQVLAVELANRDLAPGSPSGKASIRSGSIGSNPTSLKTATFYRLPHPPRAHEPEHGASGGAKEGGFETGRVSIRTTGAAPGHTLRTISMHVKSTDHLISIVARLDAHSLPKDDLG
ncbi:MAG: transposase, partial [Rhodocyclaceae bacterium]